MKSILLFFLLSSVVVVSQAQHLLPFSSSNYAGVSGVQLQPASIADSKYRLDITAFSVDLNLFNDYYSLDSYALRSLSVFKEDDLFDHYLFRNNDGNPKSAIMFGKAEALNFMLTLSKNSAIAFTPSVRFIANIDNVSQDLITLMEKDLDASELWNTKLVNSNLSMQMNFWAEYSFTYAQVLYNRDAHFVKAGATLKVLQGIGSYYGFIKDLNFELKNKDTIAYLKSNIAYGSSVGFNAEEIPSYILGTKPSLGFDFGVVYEYRPDRLNSQHNTDKNNDLKSNDANNYLFKLGLTISDIGGVGFKRNPLSKDFYADKTNLSSRQDIQNIDNLNSFIANNFDVKDIPDNYRMSLPTSISAQLDFRVLKGFYLNFIPFFALNAGTKDESKSRYLSSYNFIPRVDYKYLGVFLPFQYNEYKQFNVGLGFRLGAIWFGSNNIISNLSSKKIYGSNISVAAKVPIMFK